MFTWILMNVLLNELISFIFLYYSQNELLIFKCSSRDIWAVQSLSQYSLYKRYSSVIEISRPWVGIGVEGEWVAPADQTMSCPYIF